MGAHRTWEQFMVENLGYDKSQVHLQAEELEHFLTPALIEEIQSELGNPLKDPHGAYIPQSKAAEELVLFSMEEGQKALVLTKQPNEHIMALLWKEGLTPNYSISILKKTEKGLVARVNNQEKEISVELAKGMRVLRIA